MKISDYQIIRNTSEDKVEEEVQKALNSGWQPFGGIVYAPPDNEDQYGWFYQAVVKVESTPLDEIAGALSDISRILKDIEKSVDGRA